VSYHIKHVLGLMEACRPIGRFSIGMKRADVQKRTEKED